MLNIDGNIDNNIPMSQWFELYCVEDNHWAALVAFDPNDHLQIPTFFVLFLIQG